ncbi:MULTISPECIES: hypothetical protein [Planktothricoides]|uniref:Fibronectin type-III domain-containing protein n=2 Tax=Planktothricoides raciborskii TaxID=132608 RepID=A0AAU8JGR7_9CYAN|nr:MULTISPECIES: hypothetical protein [Planktothricoides]KOR36148.1 hypothetical protein AM228_13840 [Planktothricoides sp. SR001]MBD2543746.1 hypothetical protein [Planktothricoides raciborskii FACHB-1370]MBD2582359.1 hypothetical protein [Planktothricoides raciborskii FACHB-1261]
MKSRKIRKLVLFGLTLLIVLVGWSFNSDGKVTSMLPVTATTATQTCEIESAVGLIYQVENDPNFPVGLQAGQLLCGDENLQPTTGTKVALVCFDQGKRWEVSSDDRFQVGEYCSAPEPAVECDDSGNLCDPNPRPSGSCDSPEIKSPFSQIISNSRPSIAWKTIAGATGYTVKVESWDSDFNFQKTLETVDNSSVISQAIAFPYPDDEDPLIFGHRYEVTVEAIVASSDNCIEPDTTRFKLIQE